MRIIAILISTFKEILRQKVILTLVGISSFIILSSLILFPLSAGEEERILKDFGISAIPLLNFFLILVAGSIIFYQEFERKTIYILRSSPIKGWELGIGKLSALFLVILISVMIMVLTHQIIFLFLVRKFEPKIYASLIPFLFEAILVLSIMIFLSSFSNYLLSSFLTLGIYIIGHSITILKFLAEKINLIGLKYLILFFYFVFPNLEYFDIKTKILYNESISLEYFIFSFSYSLIYTTTLLYLFHIIFEIKEYR